MTRRTLLPSQTLRKIKWSAQELAVEELKTTVLLDPQWVTQVISRVLEDQAVKDNKAIFTPQHLQRLWGDIDDWLCDVLIELMEKFALSYKTPESPDKRLVVELLPSDEADYRTRSRGHRTDGQLPRDHAEIPPGHR